MDDGRFTLRLAKEDFKFAAGHFTLFPDGSMERLHGHNFRVRVEACGTRLGEAGMLASLAELKGAIRAACAAWDERTLIPEESERLAVRRQDGEVVVEHGDRRYRLPAADVVLLPLENVTIELLARLLWRRLAAGLEGTGVDRLAVEVEETDGQACSYARKV